VEDDVAAVSACAGADLDEVVGRANDIEIVFDYQQCVTCIDEGLEDFEELFDIGEMEPRGGFI